jgi:radical SAM-linked protein
MLPSTWQAAVTNSSRTLRGYALCMRRFRVTFTKGEPVRYISHLDLMRTWERTLRRARVRLAHSHGFNPRPRLVFAAPLALGTTSQAEIVDIVVEDDLSAPEFAERVSPALAPGIEVSATDEVPLEAPPVMAIALSCDYVVELAGAVDMAPALERFLASDSTPYERSRKGKSKQSDMRPAVVDLWVTPHGLLGMRLRLDLEGAAVRPGEVVAALDPGWKVVRTHRIALRLKEGIGLLTSEDSHAA